MTWQTPVPTRGARLTSGYGPRSTGIPGASTYHRGADLAPPAPGQRGVPVVAAGPGVVSVVSENSARGKHVRIRHDDGSSTLYQHLDRHDARVGQRVVAGTRVGLMGSTGIGAGVHLHFECYPPGANVYVLANAVDPVPFMRARGVDLRTGAQLVTNPTGSVPAPPALPTLTPSTLVAPEVLAMSDTVAVIRVRQTGAYIIADLTNWVTSDADARSAELHAQAAGVEVKEWNAGDVDAWRFAVRVMRAKVHDPVAPV